MNKVYNSSFDSRHVTNAKTPNGKKIMCVFIFQLYSSFNEVVEFQKNPGFSLH